MANQMSNDHYYIRSLTELEMKSAQAFFAQHRYVVIEDFFTDRFLSIITERIKKDGFTMADSREDIIATPFTLNLDTLMCAPAVLEMMRSISGMDRLTTFSGRIYRLLPDSGHGFGWHDDLILDRKLAVSVNLSENDYQGGNLEFRHEPSQEITVLPNKKKGRAIFFIIDPGYKHRVTNVTGPHPKVAYTGWYS